MQNMTQGFSRDFKRKKKYLNMNGIRSTFYVVYKAGSSNKAKGMFLRERFHSWNWQHFSSWKQVYQEQSNS